jgi:hypothetical protein
MHPDGSATVHFEYAFSHLFVIGISLLASTKR